MGVARVVQVVREGNHSLCGVGPWTALLTGCPAWLGCAVPKSLERKISQVKMAGSKPVPVEPSQCCAWHSSAKKQGHWEQMDPASREPGAGEAGTQWPQTVAASLVQGRKANGRGAWGCFCVSPLKCGEREQKNFASLQKFLADCTLVSHSLLNPGPQKSTRIMLLTPT